MSTKDQTGIEDQEEAFAGEVSGLAMPGFPRTEVFVESNSLSAAAVSAILFGLTRDQWR
jgi:hypothetical protein